MRARPDSTTSRGAKPSALHARLTVLLRRAVEPDGHGKARNIATAALGGKALFVAAALTLTAMNAFAIAMVIATQASGMSMVWQTALAGTVGLLLAAALAWAGLSWLRPARPSALDAAVPVRVARGDRYPRGRSGG